MGEFLNHLISGTDQFLILAGGVACWLGLASLGGLVVGRERLGEGDVIAGWAVVVVAFSLPGVFLGATFTPIFWCVVTVALVSMFVPFRRDERVLPAGALQAAVLALPLLIVVAARSGSEWEEISRWLPLGRHMFQSDTFPLGAGGEWARNVPAHPYAWPLLTYMPQRLIGSFVESAGAVMNVLLLVGTGLLAVRLWLLGAGRPVTIGRSWAACAVAVLAGTILSPTFVETVALTGAAVVPTAAATAALGVLGWMVVDALAEGRDRAALRYAWQFGLVGLALVDIERVNVAILAAIVVGTGLVALRDPSVRVSRWLAGLPAMLLPPALILGVWTVFVAGAPAIAVPSLTPPTEWRWGLSWRDLEGMASVVADKGGYFGIMAAAVAIGGWGLVRARGPLGRFGVVVAAAFLGYNGFLVAADIGFFAVDDATRAASFWRDNQHLGLLATVFAAHVGGVVLRNLPEGRWWSRAIGWAAIAVVVVAPIALAKTLRFDLDPPKPYYRAVARDIAGDIPRDGTVRMVLLDPAGTGESTGFMRLALAGHPNAEVRDPAPLGAITAEQVRVRLEQDRPTHILVHSVNPAVVEALGQTLKPGLSYLLVANGAAWRVVKAWRQPEGG